MNAVEAGAVVFELEWLPPVEVRGNSRSSWQRRAGISKRLRQSGYFHGLSKIREVEKQRGETETETEREGIFPLQGDLSLEIEAWYIVQTDWDNLVIGYKSWIDGLEDAEVFKNDLQIRDVKIRLYKTLEEDGERSRITLRWSASEQV